MTHEYTILTGGLVLPGGDAPGCTAIAWAADTVLAMGSDEEVCAISRGDSCFVALNGRVVVALTDGDVLEVGGAADLAVLAGGATAETGAVVAVIRGGKLVSGGIGNWTG